MPFPGAKVIKGSPQLLSVEFLLMSCWLGRSLTLPTLQAVTIALHWPPDPIARTFCSRAREYPTKEILAHKVSTASQQCHPGRQSFYHNGLWRLFISHFRAQIHCHTLGYGQETPMESLHLMCDSCHEGFILGAPPLLISWLCVEAI